MTADDVQRYGHRTLMDVFNALPGFQTSYDRNFGYIGARGFGVPGDYNTRILILIDGHRVYEKGFPNACYETIFNDPGNRTLEKQAYLNFKYQHLLDNGAEVTARLFYAGLRVVGDYIYDRADPGDPLERAVFVVKAWGDWWGTELLLTREWFDNHRTTLGTEYRNNLREDQGELDNADVYRVSRENSSVAVLSV